MASMHELQKKLEAWKERKAGLERMRDLLHEAEQAMETLHLAPARNGGQEGDVAEVVDILQQQFHGALDALIDAVTTSSSSPVPAMAALLAAVVDRATAQAVEARSRLWAEGGGAMAAARAELGAKLDGRQAALLRSVEELRRAGLEDVDAGRLGAVVAAYVEYAFVRRDVCGRHAQRSSGAEEAA